MEMDWTSKNRLNWWYTHCDYLIPCTTNPAAFFRSISTTGMIEVAPTRNNWADDRGLATVSSLAQSTLQLISPWIFTNPTEGETAAPIKMYVAPRRNNRNDSRGVNILRDKQVTEFKTCLHLFPLRLPPLRPPLWSSGQSFWLQIQRSRVRSPALPDFLSSSGSGTGSTRPREVKLRSYLNKKVAAPGSENRD